MLVVIIFGGIEKLPSKSRQIIVLLYVIVPKYTERDIFDGYNFGSFKANHRLYCYVSFTGYALFQNHHHAHWHQRRL